MATMVANRVFVDTNVLVHSVLPIAPRHAAAVQKLKALRGGGADLWISRQILREYMAALTRPQVYSRPVPAATVAADVGGFLKDYQIAEDGSAVTSRLLHLFTSIPVGGKQIHDANIVATMLAHNIPRLLTHNTADFVRFSAFITVEPL